MATSKLSNELIAKADKYLQSNIEAKSFPTIRALADELKITRTTFYKYARTSQKMARIKSEIMQMQNNHSKSFC